MNKVGGKRFLSRIGIILLIGVTLFQTSCGTILYPERRGQPRGQLDIGVVALDGLGLVLFLVPGIIAFVVDFSTGAIYLPGTSYGGPMIGMAPRKIHVEPGKLTPERVEAVVREQTGKTINLQPGTYRAMHLRRLDDFTPEAVAGLKKDARPARVIFRASDK